MNYEYKCDLHGEFEATQKITDPPLEVCPTCEKDKVANPPKPTRLISGSSFVLNGGGWARDKYSK